MMKSTEIAQRICDALVERGTATTHFHVDGEPRAVQYFSPPVPDELKEDLRNYEIARTLESCGS